MGQILCVKKVPFRKSGHILINCTCHHYGGIHTGTGTQTHTQTHTDTQTHTLREIG